MNIVYRYKNNRENKLFQCCARNKRKAMKELKKRIKNTALDFFTFCDAENIDFYMNGLYYNAK